MNRKIRKARDLIQKQLADQTRLARLAHSTVYKTETGRQEFTVASLQVMVGVLRVKTETLH
jgi:transcriptional regulator with XRE-family HTH domain